MAYGVAREWVRLARALEELPALCAAFESGGISWDQLRPLVRLANPPSDQAWAEKGSEMYPSELWREVARQKQRTRQQAEDDHKMRRLRMDWDEDRPSSPTHTEAAPSTGRLSARPVAPSPP